jgi:hypothetical protein
MKVKSLMALLLIWVVTGCIFEGQEVYIRDVSKDTSWIYQQIPTPLFERQFYILIDGELDSMAVLVAQHRIFGLGPPYDPDDKVIGSTPIKLPEGSFKLYVNADYSGKEQFIFHPLLAKKGWVNVQISSKLWNPADTSRRYISTVPGLGYGGLKITPDTNL